jgi:hypothetical protein
MRAACKLCGEVITIFATANRTEEFDGLAGKVSYHIATRHKDEFAELSDISYLAGKVYAITLVEGGRVPDWIGLKRTWHNALLARLGGKNNPSAAQHMRYLGTLGLLAQCSVYVPEHIRETIERAFEDAVRFDGTIAWRRVLDTLEVNQL